MFKKTRVYFTEKSMELASKMNLDYLKVKVKEERGDIAWDKMGKAVITVVVVGIVIGGLVALFNTVIFPLMGKWFTDLVK